jgi:hypothetical protein
MCLQTSGSAPEGFNSEKIGIKKKPAIELLIKEVFKQKLE